MEEAMSESFPQEQINSIIGKHFNLKAGAVHIHNITTGHFNTTYAIQADHYDLILRIAPSKDAGFVFYEVNMMAQEPELHRIVRERTQIPVPQIFVYDTSHESIDRDYLIMERLPGRPLTEMRNLSRRGYDDVLAQVGHHLGALHEIVAEQYGYLGAHHPMEPQDRWWRAFRIMWDRMTDDIFAVGAYDESERRFMKEILTDHTRYFDREVPASLLHMDVWHQNILVDDRGEVTGIVDWDRALWGDVEIEFSVLDYCGISEPAFWKGYGQTRDASAAARIRRRFYLLYELQKYIVIERARRSNVLKAERYKRQVMQLVQQLIG